MVSLFNYPAGEFQKILLRLTVPVRHVCFDKSGRNLAVAADDNVIRLVNVALAQAVMVRGHTDSVRPLPRPRAPGATGLCVAQPL